MSGVSPTLEVGPYCDEDMQNWWVPIAVQPNRMKAAHEVRQCVDPDLVIRYVEVDDEASFDLVHDWPCGRDDETDDYPPCTVVSRAWRFTTEERHW